MQKQTLFKQVLDLFSDSPQGKTHGGREKNNKVALVLGSGGSRGWAHLGALQALIENNLHFDLVVGSSFGAIAGAYYASHNIDGLEKLAKKSSSFFKNISYLDFSVSENGIISGNRFLKRMEEFMHVTRFRDLQIPLGIVATDLHGLEEVFFMKGNLTRAIRASIGIPGLLAPLRWRGYQFADGGIINSVPVNLARHMGADVAIAIDLNGSPEKRYTESSLGSLSRASDIMFNRLRLYNRWQFPAELYLEPKFKGGYNILDFHRTEEGVAAGRAVVLENLDKIEKIFSQSSRKKRNPLSMIEKIEGLDYHIMKLAAGKKK